MTKTTMTPEEVHNYFSSLIEFAWAQNQDGYYNYEPDFGPPCRVSRSGTNRISMDWGNPQGMDESMPAEIEPAGWIDAHGIRRSVIMTVGIGDDEYKMMLKDLEPGAKNVKRLLKKFYKQWDELLVRLEAENDAVIIKMNL